MIPLAIPNLTGKEAEYAQQAIASGHIGPDGDFVRRFEKMVAKAAGRKWAIATITGTAALHVSAVVLGFGQTCVSVPHNVFPAMRNIMNLMGCQLDEGGAGINHDFQLYYSYHPGGDARVIADRAPSIGEPLWQGEVDCYSFAANKIVTCGHGGAVCGDDEIIEIAIREDIRQGYGRPGRLNYRMANINAAIGCAQMERLDELKEAKRRIWGRYAEHLPMIERGPSRWMATTAIDFDDLPRGFEVREEPSGGISLPCSTNLTEADQDIVIRECVKYL